MEKPVKHDIIDLKELLDQLEWAADTEQGLVSVDTIITAVGARSFAPLLLLVGVMIASPLSGIPVLPSIAAIIVLLVSVQMLMGSAHFWLPRWILDRKVPQGKLTTAIKWSRPPARFIDHFLRPRILVLVKGSVARVLTALICLVIATIIPFLEFVPFSSSLAGATLAAFALALVANDGLVALIAYMAAGVTIWLGAYGLFL